MVGSAAVSSKRDRPPEAAGSSARPRTKNTRRDFNQKLKKLLDATHPNINFVIKLIKDGANPNTRNACEMTALHFAAVQNDSDAVGELLSDDIKASVNAKDREGRTALYWALIHHESNIAEILLENNADVKLTYSKKMKHTALHLALMHGNLEAVPLLLARGADRKATDYLGRTPEDYARERGYPEDVITSLMSASAHASPSR